MDNRQLELPFETPPVGEGAKDILQELDRTIELGDYDATLKAMRQLNDYVWKTFHRSLQVNADYI